MMNKKLLSIDVASVITLTCFVTAFAAESTPIDPGVKQAKIEAKQAKQAERLAMLKERASKLGINVDGLTFAEAKAKIKAAADTKRQANTQKLSERAAKLGVDITGLSNKEAREKIKVAAAEKRAANAAKKAAKSSNAGSL